MADYSSRKRLLALLSPRSSFTKFCPASTTHGWLLFRKRMGNVYASAEFAPPALALISFFITCFFFFFFSFRALFACFLRFLPDAFKSPAGSWKSDERVGDVVDGGAVEDGNVGADRDTRGYFACN